MFKVYAIQSEKDGRIYVGITDDIKRRLKEHEAGKTKSTKGYRPWKLVYSELIKDRASARDIEKKLKSGFGKEFLKSIVNK